MFPPPFSLFSIYTEHDCQHKNRKEEKKWIPPAAIRPAVPNIDQINRQERHLPRGEIANHDCTCFLSCCTCDNLTVRQMPSRTRQVLLGLVMRPELCRRNCELTVQLLAPSRRHRRRQCNDMR